MELRKRSTLVAVSAGLLAIAAFLIYLPSQLGAALTIPPDSSEYSICLANLLEHGRFGFTLNGEWYPSRYSPWFSLLCLTPAYLLGGGNVLCLHWAILVFALAVLFVVWKMGRLCGLGKLSILPPVLLMFLPDFVFYSRVAMTEIPYSALFAILGLVFVRFVNSKRMSARSCFIIGLLVAWAGLVRFTGFAIAIPFGIAVLLKNMECIEHTEASTSLESTISCISWLKLISRLKVGWNRKLLLLAAIGLPICLALLANAGYNWTVFGSPFRSGYHYWCSVPVDFPDLTFNLGNALNAAEFLLTQPIIWISLVFGVVSLAFAVYAISTRSFARYKNFLLLEGYVFVHTAVLVVMYLGYYWIDTRFFLPVSICSVPLFFIALNGLLQRFGSRVRLVLSILAFIVCLVFVVKSSNRYLYIVLGRQVWLSEAQVSGTVLPEGSVAIQRGDPNIVEFFGFRDKGLVLFPVSRENFDYVSDMVAPVSIAGHCQKPDSCWQKIIPSLVDSGICRLPFLHVFKETPNQIQKYLHEGKRVFILQDMYFKEEFESIKSQIEEMGMTLKLFGAWNVPGIPPNPVRHLYDKLLFPGGAMDSRPEITVAYYEIVPAAERSKSLGLTAQNDF